MTNSSITDVAAGSQAHLAKAVHPALERRVNVLDNLITEAGRAMHVLSRSALATRPNPAGRNTGDADASLDTDEIQHAAGLMRVNHVGEICAQALYRGQALFCKDQQVQELLYHAATEEVDHLVWCDDRLKELGSKPSVFNPLWYAASFGLGVVASRAGTPYNLGFMAETERQVEEHLDAHLKDLPQQDLRSRKIVVQMRDDEIGHRTTAEDNGATALPAPVKLAMKLMSKVMTTSAYRV
ncbi:2-polyprenyl-3-methyl-6-methoxy-1,4-benzoquinone monooxygenase [Paenalcaligenes niemegkensis]|uniref:2-polyprenyl-3-methyl-6-methoxy-1,4-benzoquinone monooxygenase n=1 Tax=Paenalcaligenes niemegkensis TaxID=2895469 RepID=UPI001EE873C5|nr:2-polyprenyl-3-methyl-6-methoxy-1,4-benzoquinone monooxygenase [Paenalcaligenes niemegkensis]MCQ9617258.1 2-polyprenyl-3-methyl-6-methoxy-1,4-benzoquinone monooxygenase [Paenalcaligenes niemegkensis]